METVKIRFYREDPEAQIPEIAYNGSSGAFDIRATRTVIIPAHGRAEGQLDRGGQDNAQVTHRGHEGRSQDKKRPKNKGYGDLHKFAVAAYLRASVQ